MQHGDNEPQASISPTERDDLLDARYREEGWGLITDKAFGGRLRPLNVESNAREVARWAYELAKSTTATINEQGTRLIRLEKELEEAAHFAGIVARQAPMIEGLKSALRLKDVEHKRLRLDWARELHNRASVEMRLAECELVLAEIKSREGGNMPTTLNSRALQEWLEPKDEGGCCAEH